MMLYAADGVDDGDGDDDDDDHHQVIVGIIVVTIAIIIIKCGSKLVAPLWCCCASVPSPSAPGPALEIVG